MNPLSAKLDGHWFLNEIGADLDHGRPLTVKAEGVLWPSTAPAASTKVLGLQEHQHAGNTREGEGRERQREGEGQGRQGQTGSTAQELRSAELAGRISGHHATDLGNALAEYRNFRLRLAPPGAWLTGTIRPVPGLPDAATVVMSYPFEPSFAIRAWAWWDNGVWVGPRHTNYGDGSICSFEPTDQSGIWQSGEPLLNLMDFHSCWIGRHIFLSRVGRWPGPQALHSAHERLTEHRAGEQCGCGSKKLYPECHQQLDEAMSPSGREKEFRLLFPYPFRKPPRNLADCVTFASERPVSRGYLIARAELPRLLRTPYSVFRDASQSSFGHARGV